MNKVTLAPGIVVYKNIEMNIMPTILNFKDEDWSDEYVLHGSGVVDVDKEVRSTRSFEVPHNLLKAQNQDLLEISNIITSSINEAEQDYFFDHFIEPRSHQDFKILRYIEGDHFSSHSDDGGGTFRRVSTVYYINDDYQGGEIEFTRFGILYKPEAKDFIIFPSSYAYTHRVLPVTGGIRYAIASWIR
jgi:predicted 2-oxoglutarate/Fe(II)-dependent dioxygenase YbiX